MVLHGFEEVDHTADIALRVWGEDFYSLLKQAARGMYALMGSERQHDTVIDHIFFVEPGSRESKLVDFLSEILYLCEDKGFLFDTFEFIQRNDGLIVRVKGSLVKSIDRTIKAVTFHNLEVQETSEGFSTLITFDV